MAPLNVPWTSADIAGYSLDYALDDGRRYFLGYKHSMRVFDHLRNPGLSCCAWLYRVLFAASSYTALAA